MDIRNQCMEAGVAFRFHQTGAHLLKDGRLYEIPRHLQAAQARRAKVAYDPKGCLLYTSAPEMLSSLATAKKYRKTRSSMVCSLLFI